MTNAVLAKLRAFVTGAPIEECELCAEAISVDHEHLLEPDARRVFCACRSCAALFSEQQERQGARYLRLQRRAARLGGLSIDDASWADLRVPGGLAYFTMRSRTGEVVATFPGRSGIIESFVPLKAWSLLERRFPVLKSVLPDVEALLVRRTSRHQDYFQASVDHCYELAELLRGAEVPVSSPELAAVQGFFERLDVEAGQKRHSRRPTA
ncbi:MAG: hypothetical protein EOO73_27945 [Myxococcales bacterium]|nr:MAG: hypothetical protein EOO73_27945 [Myxococcales bacterium]